MAEWPIAVVLKTTDSQESGGSNPSPTVFSSPDRPRRTGLNFLPALARSAGSRFSVASTSAERWQSGRSRRLAKALTGVFLVRGFESPPLRQFPSRPATRGGVGAAVLLLSLLLLSQLFACSGPALEVTTTPPDATVYLDNRQLPERTPITRPLPYYGTLRVEAERAHHRPATRAVTAAEPVTPWLFPFDLPLEVLQRAFGRNDVQVAIPLAPDTTPAPPPPSSDTLRSRAADLGVRR